MIEQIGGVFLYSNSPKKLAEWYKSAFKLKYEFEMNEELFGLSMYYTCPHSNQRYTVFSIAKAKEKLSEEREKTFTLNLRISDMDEAEKHLSDLEIEMKGPEVHDEGKFAWVTDPDGNTIELWEDTKA